MPEHTSGVGLVLDGSLVWANEHSLHFRDCKLLSTFSLARATHALLHEPLLMALGELAP